MSFLSGKQAFLQILKDEGVDTMFGNPGTTELPLMDGLVREPSIRYILALQEAVAISMADGYAQASGKLGVVNVHTSPGLGNAMGMLYDAYEAGTPLLVTAGPARSGHEPHRAHPLVRSAPGGAPLREVVARDHPARGPAARGPPRGQDRDGASHRPGVHLAAGGRAERGARAGPARSPPAWPRASAATAPRSRPPPISW